MVLRVAVAQPAQNRDRLLDARLVNHHRLEAAFKRGVGFDVLSIFVEGRRADALQFAAGEFRLYHRTQIERAFGSARADERVQFVDEQNDVARTALDFVENAFDASFEFAAILRAGDERPEREREHALPAQRRRNGSGDDPLRQSFDDRRFSDAGLADEHGIILAAAREDRNETVDFVVASDDRIEFAGAREFREVARKTSERRGSAEAPRQLVERRCAAFPFLAPQAFGEQDASRDESGGGQRGSEEGQRSGDGASLCAGRAEPAPAVKNRSRARSAVFARRVHRSALPIRAPGGFRAVPETSRSRSPRR